MRNPQNAVKCPPLTVQDHRDMHSEKKRRRHESSRKRLPGRPSYAK